MGCFFCTIWRTCKLLQPFWRTICLSTFSPSDHTSRNKKTIEIDVCTRAKDKNEFTAVLFEIREDERTLQYQLGIIRINHSVLEL